MRAVVYLKHAQAASDHDEEIRLMSEGSHSTSDDTEHGVQEEAKCRDTEQDVVQVRLFFGAELQRLHPAERLGTGGRRIAPFHYTTTNIRG